MNSSYFCCCKVNLIYSLLLKKTFNILLNCQIEFFVSFDN